MKLYLISQDENDNYDSYDSAVVCAPDEDTASKMDPGGKNGAPYDFSARFPSLSWARSLDKVTVLLIGEAAPGIPVGVVCASFNAG